MAIQIIQNAQKNDEDMVIKIWVNVYFVHNPKRYS